MIDQFFDIVTHLNERLAQWTAMYGNWMYGILFLIIFCETGLVVAPFLPGDSLLFAAGAVSANPKSHLTLPVLLVLLPLAAILGDNLNYWIGRFIGPKVFKKESSWFFSVKNLHRTQAFYDKHGRKTVVLARFVPIVRTFAPFVAGVGKMEYLKFFLYGVIGAFLWVGICCTAGYLFAGNAFVQDHFEIVILGIIGISLLPAIITWVASMMKSRRERRAVGAITHQPVSDLDPTHHE